MDCRTLKAMTSLPDGARWCRLGSGSYGPPRPFFTRCKNKPEIDASKTIATPPTPEQVLMIGGWVRPSLRFENDQSGARDESNMRLLVETKR